MPSLLAVSPAKTAVTPEALFKIWRAGILASHPNNRKRKEARNMIAAVSQIIATAVVAGISAALVCTEKRDAEQNQKEENRK